MDYFDDLAKHAEGLLAQTGYTQPYTSEQAANAIASTTRPYTNEQAANAIASTTRPYTNAQLPIWVDDHLAPRLVSWTDTPHWRKFARLHPEQAEFIVATCKLLDVQVRLMHSPMQPETEHYSLNLAAERLYVWQIFHPATSVSIQWLSGIDSDGMEMWIKRFGVIVDRINEARERYIKSGKPFPTSEPASESILLTADHYFAHYFAHGHNRACSGVGTSSQSALGQATGGCSGSPALAGAAGGSSNGILGEAKGMKTGPWTIC
jgi:hypothetical protein